MRIQVAETVAVAFAILGAGLIGASLPDRVLLPFQPAVFGAGLACVAIAAVIVLWLVTQGWRDPDNWIR